MFFWEKFHPAGFPGYFRELFQQQIKHLYVNFQLGEITTANYCESLRLARFEAQSEQIFELTAESFSHSPSIERKSSSTAD